jgi:thymidylate synthase (FAD)
MRLIHASFEILDNVNGVSMLERIERYGRTCYKSEDKITFDSAAAFVANILKRGHESVIEHEKISVRVICDRGVSHEIVRHRIASYSQESTRYCDYSAGAHVTFIIPCWLDITPGVYSSFKLDDTTTWMMAMLQAEAAYNALRGAGWKPEQARSVLPNSLKTEIVMTMNLREWLHFFKLRTTRAAHPQMREITIPLLAEFKHLIPVVFDDIIPEV